MRGLDFEDAVGDLEHRHVERAAAEVEDQDRLVLFLVEAVGQCGRGRLVDDALDLETGDLAGVLGGLALVVVEVGGHRDHRAVDTLAEVCLGVGLQLLQDHRADLGRGEILVVDLRRERRRSRRESTLYGTIDSSSFTSASLRPMKRLIEKIVFSGLVTAWRLARVPTRRSPLVGERDHRRRSAAAFRVFDDRRLAALEDGHARVGRAEVDSDCLSHLVICSYGRGCEGKAIGRIMTENLSLIVIDTVNIRNVRETAWARSGTSFSRPLPRKTM